MDSEDERGALYTWAASTVCAAAMSAMGPYEC